MLEIYSLDQLLEEVERGVQPKFLFFWGHEPRVNGRVDKSCFSQWYPASFEVDGVHYPTAEHFMMAEKARLFKDNDALKQILKSSHPDAAKNLGRQVVGFEQAVWEAHRFDIVVKGNVAKFSQNEALNTFLRNTQNRILVEASPRDTIWGIGMDEKNKKATDPFEWQGLNLLGFALMKARDSLNH